MVNKVTAFMLAIVVVALVVLASCQPQESIEVELRNYIR